MFDLIQLLKTGGYLVVFGFIFAESGLLVGFFLPGDSLLFTAGFLASQGFLNFPFLLAGCFAAAVIGNTVGYYFGRKVGPALFRREESLFFSRHNVIVAKEFFDIHGPKTIFLARFVPIVRTFATIIAGVAGMDYKKFEIYNVLGALVWAVGITSLGYFLGNVIPNVDRYILPMVGVVIVVSLLPGVWHILRDPVSRSKILSLLKRGR